MNFSARPAYTPVITPLRGIPPQMPLVRNLAKDRDLRIRQGIWLYFLLLLFEGALRKWFLPGLATPLLIIRDPLALWLVFMVWKRGMLPPNLYLTGMLLIGFIGVCTAGLLGHGSIPVALYGARIFFIHFPLIFVIGQIFTREDVIRMGKVTLWISIPMAILIALQFYSPQSAWVNRGVGGDMGGAGFGGIMGYFRPPGTFSFTNGTTLFFSFVACFVFYFWIKPEGLNRLLLIAATMGLMAAIPLSISRGLFFQFGVSLVFALLAIFRKPKYMGRMMLAGVGGVFVLLLLSQASFFQTATEAFTTRFETANEEEGGLEGVLGGRYLGGLIGPILDASEQPFFGYGLGMGTNVGSMLLAGDRIFLISEEEWARLIGELGPLMGIIVILIRMGLSAKIAFAGYERLVQGELLPWMLLSFGLLTIPQAQWAQPTSLGFCVMIAGLLIASFRTAEGSTDKGHT